MVKLSSSLIGKVSTIEERVASNSETMVIFQVNTGKDIASIKWHIKKEDRKNAAEPSRLLWAKTLFLPNFIPITADKGSDMARIKTAVTATGFGKVMMVSKIAII